MKILYIVDSFHVGGTETQVAEMSCRLPRDRFQLTVCCLKKEGRLLQRVEDAGIEVVEFSPGGTMLSVRAARQIFRLARFMRKRQFQIVHAHDLWSNLMGVPAARLARVPLIICSRRDLGHLSWYTPLRRKFMAGMEHLSDWVTVNSAAIQELLVQQDGLQRKKIIVIPNGVDFEKFRDARGERVDLLPPSASGSFVIACVANMRSEVKGHRFLIAAAEMLCREFPRALFVLAGDGELRASLEQQVIQLGLRERVLFLGDCNHVAELLHCSDLFVLPSLAEGLPNALLEAMAAGLPVVSTRVGGAAEVIGDGSSGLLVAPASAEALAAALLRLMRDRHLRERLARCAQERVCQEYSFAALLNRLASLYGMPQDVD